MPSTMEERERRFHAHATARAHELNGPHLAAFWQRLLGYLIDVLVAVLIWWPLEFAWRRFLIHEKEV